MSDGMSVQEILSTPTAQAIISVSILLVMLAVGYYVVQRFRDRTDEDHLTASELITNFREMYHEGDISDTEFRTIKTVLEGQFRDELVKESEASTGPVAPAAQSGPGAATGPADVATPQPSDTGPDQEDDRKTDTDSTGPPAPDGTR